MAKTGDNMGAISKLKKQIIPFPPTLMEAMGIPEEDKNIFTNYMLVPIDLLVKAVWNYKGQDEYKSKALRENLKRNGQIENLHTRELPSGYYEVCNGNHRLDELQALGKKFALVYHHGKISEAEAKRVAIETNETRFETNEVKLSAILQELSKVYDIEEMALTMPYSVPEIEDHISSLEFDYLAYASEFNFDLKDYERPIDPETGKEKPVIIKVSPEQLDMIDKIAKSGDMEDGKKILVGLNIKVRTTLEELKMMNQLMGKDEIAELNTYSAQDFINAMRK